MTFASWCRSVINGWRIQRALARNRRSLRSVSAALWLPVHVPWISGSPHGVRGPVCAATGTDRKVITTTHLAAASQRFLRHRWKS